MKITKKILIIEDELSLLQALVDKFKMEKFLVVSAKNGKEGLELAKKEKPDLILLDIIMPITDGITMLEQLRQDEWGKEVPVMVLTNLNDIEKTSEALKSGVRDYLVKTDWKLDDVVKKVKDKLSV
ncbi:MAG: response regulator [Candidatus Buchananbacteria bacterium]